MSDIDSLEDMLAALETPSNTGRGGGRSNAGRSGSTAPSRASTQTIPPDDDDIDAFLNEIDQESKGRQPSVSRPPAQSNANRGAPQQQSAQSRSPVQAQNSGRGAAPNNAASRNPAPSNAGVGGRNPAPSNADVGGRNPAPSNARPVSTGPSGSRPSVGDGQSELKSQGYEIHNNKGKFYSPAKTSKASDFRINGTTSTRVGFVHAITLRSLDDYGNPAKIDSPKDFVGITMTHQESGASVQSWLRDNGDCTYNCAFFADQSGTVRMEIILCGNPMFDINVQVEDIGESVWIAKPALPARPKELFVINIVTVDGTRPVGVAPFEVQTMGDAEQLRLVNNGDGTYKFQCVPQSNGHLTVQISLHGQPIRDSPVTIKVGDGKNPMKVKQESGPVEVISDTRNRTQSTDSGQVFDAPDQTYGSEFDDPPPEEYQDNFDGGGTYDGEGGASAIDQDVSNDDLAALLDELGG